MCAGPVPVTIKDIDMMKRTLIFPAAAVCAAVTVTSCGNNNFTAGTIEIAEKIALADEVLDNSGDKKELLNKVDGLLRKYED